MATILITPPSEQPVALADVKVDLRIEHAEEDGRLALLIAAARQLAEQMTGRAFAPQTWEIVADAFPEAFILSPAPAATIVSVKYIDTGGIEQTLNESGYQLDKDSLPGYLIPAYGYAWPETRAQANAVRVRFT